MFHFISSVFFFLLEEEAEDVFLPSFFLLVLPSPLLSFFDTFDDWSFVAVIGGGFTTTAVAFDDVDSRIRGPA